MSRVIAKTKTSDALKVKVKTKAGKAATGDLLFEIGCEEIPAGMISKAAEELKSLLTAQLAATGLVGAPTIDSVLEVFGGTMLLVLVAGGILYEFARGVIDQA